MKRLISLKRHCGLREYERVTRLREKVGYVGESVNVRPLGGSN